MCSFCQSVTLNLSGKGEKKKKIKRRASSAPGALGVGEGERREGAKKWENKGGEGEEKSLRRSISGA